MNHKQKLSLRINIIEKMRDFFKKNSFLEVQTPQLVTSPGMEIHLNAFETTYTPEFGNDKSQKLYLATSPEYHMKRLLANGWPRIFQICKAFRNGELSEHHSPEFTICEWYEAGASLFSLMNFTENLISEICESVLNTKSIEFLNSKISLKTPFNRITMRQAFIKYAGFDFYNAPDSKSLQSLAENAGNAFDKNYSSWEDVFFKVFLEKVEPSLVDLSPVFVYEYPACMSALSKIKANDKMVCERFELYAGGLELANAFFELNDPKEQLKRFEQDKKDRQAEGKTIYPIDKNLISSLSTMPDCSGIALGVDRLCMLLTNSKTIDEVLFFPGGEF